MAKCSFYETRGWGKNYCLKKNDYVDNTIYYDYCNTYRYDNCPIYKNSGSSGGGCYLTTACVEHKGLPDDCVQLETLREFRDGYMAHTEKGIDEIKEYYSKAPQIVDAINASAEREEILEHIFDDVVEPCVKLINEGNEKEAHEKYRAMVKELEEKFIQ